MTSVERGWAERSADVLIQNLSVPLAQMERGQGCYLWDNAGKQYLDFLGGIAVNSLGHCHPAVVQALTEQASRLDHISNYFVSRPQLDLAERLLDLAGATGGGVFLANSGTEANEAALKLARLHGNSQGKSRIIAFEGAFHGRTMGALALTAKAKYRDPFAPLTPGIEHLPVDEAALREAMDDQVAAIFVEPIQGEAGVVELPAGFLEAARELADRHGSLLILDEVQTGVGRTGRWFGFQHTSVVPDAITVAKGLGSGFPIGALVAFPSCSGLFYPGSHGTTFGGNPLAARVALQVLQVLEDAAVLENVQVQSERLRTGLAELGSDLIASVRGRGLLLGIQLTRPVAAEVTAAAFARGLIINAPAPDVIRLAPPLVVGRREVGEFLELFAQSLDAS
ncbi:acetylornithine transaminase [Scrofimicrobium sp. R131]|uniref:Acetylornithine aminotransferase n=1 Tax=Scrofimicrobium appendicitidis TaxID=3079930 RepID=A0AAU7V4I7_9ACTO